MHRRDVPVDEREDAPQPPQGPAFQRGETLLMRDPIWDRDALVEFRAKDYGWAVVRVHDRFHRVPLHWLRRKETMR